MRRSSNKVIAGVCAGIGESMGIESVWIRLAFVLGTLFLGVGPIGIMPLVYLVMYLVMDRG